MKELFAGSIGGIVQVLSGQPFDTVKVRLQTQPGKYSSAVDCVKQTYLQEGFLGFYKGTLTPLIGIGACVSIQFGALEAAKRYFVAQNRKQQQHQHQQQQKRILSATNPAVLDNFQLFLSGAFSGLANSVLSGPIEHIRIRLQASSNSGYTGPGDLIKKVTAQHGISGLYKGQAITLLRESVGYGIYFSTYEWLMQRQMSLQKTEKRSDVASWRQMLFGAASGYTLWLVIYPVDAIKSKIQTDGFSGPDRKFTSSFDCARKVIAAEGMAGLYRGFGTCMLRAGPVNGVTFVAYEMAMSLMN